MEDNGKITKTVQEEGILQLVTFHLGGEEFAMDILKVQEINRMVSITQVPKTPFYVEGVINLRGKVIPVIDLRKRFGLEFSEKTQNSRIIVIEVVGNTVGLIVDSVSEVLRLPSKTVEPPPPLVTGVDSEYIMGVGKVEDRLLILLDMNKVFGAEEVQALSAVA
ncbi:MAG TPA: chemotaxis protein CheW [Nitrospirota bacterium]|jgi:purine-binding chemotaxis protein CheW